MKQILKTGYNLFRNELLSSNYFIVTLPPLKIIPWEMDGGQDEVVTIREEEVSSYIAYSLQQVEVHDESSESRPKNPVFCQHRESFLELSRDCNMTEPHYISSLSRCDRWDAKGGKSGAIFSKSRDTRLIIKEINQAEFNSFDNFGPMYFKYMKEAKKTFLAKIYGLYKVALGQTKFIMVMENLNFNRVIAMQYDLKGLVHGRFAPHSAQVLLDQNFLSD
ncbi:phosphatidylinositol-4-phosphate 5-kinase family protein [Raphanus sativus]|nr:phosphatidylinositol-4-phosphate 5-kinase family protein [Raphanus sativus]